MANVAKGAKVSIALIHKYFGNREGLIAEVLADRIESDYKRENKRFLEDVARSTPSLNPETVAGLMPMPEDEWRREIRWLRIEARAASQRIPELRARLSDATLAMVSESENTITAARELSGNASTIPARTIAWAMFSYADGFSSRDLNDNTISNDSYLPLIAELIRNHVL
ncbi:MAG: TetR/AcrR family transcriptional regulator [Actinobacteria bacterium]|nr:TetR/AcrR family transcriptional regulator [Actinomycetota bacterium]